MKKLLLLSVVMLASVAVNANPDAAKCNKGGCPEFNIEKMMEFQAQAIVNKIGLDDATAAKFKDLYKAYAKEVHETLGKECEKMSKKAEKCKKDSAAFNMSDADVKSAVKARYAMGKKLANLEEKYFDKFCGIMSARQAERVMKSIKDGHKKFGKKCNKNFGKKGDCGKKCDKKGQCKKDKQGQCEKTGNCGQQCHMGHRQQMPQPGQRCMMGQAGPRADFGPVPPCKKECDKKPATNDKTDEKKS